MQVSDVHWSEDIARQVVWLSGKLPFGDVAEIMKELGQVSISKSSVWRLCQNWGEKFRVEEEKRLERDSLPICEDLPNGDKRMGISMDGFMVHIAEEGWKEVKAGSVFEIEKERTLNKETLAPEEIGRAREVSHVAHLGGPELFGKHLWGEALRRDWQSSSETQIVGDAARWIWRLSEKYFYKSHMLVDWFHSVEHLANAGEVYYGSDTVARENWLKEQKTALFREDTKQVIRTLKEKVKKKRGASRKKLLQELTFFENNQRKMRYKSLRDQGWLVGSGIIESAAKQYKTRFAGPGMRWKRSSMERMLPIRATVMSHDFNVKWHKLYYSPTN